MASKSKGAHRERSLTAVFIRNAKPGFYSDGNGLYLKVDQSGAKRWIQRIVIQGKRVDLGLGSTKIKTLADARKEAIENKNLIREGGDPRAEKRKQREIPNFEEAALKVYELHRPGWKNEKHGQQWINTLTEYAYPSLSRKRVSEITSTDILSCIAPIWHTKTETATRVKQRINTVMKWCLSNGYISINPVEGVSAALPKRPDKVTPHRALPFEQTPAAIQTIKNSKAFESTKLALLFLVYTAARSGEVRFAKWEEINGSTWTIPKERMKTKKPHRVPLCKEAKEILKLAEQYQDKSGYIFPGTVKGKALSENTFNKLLKDLNIDCVAHGFRTSFRMWAAEKTSIPHQVCEFALAHVVGDKAERAYQRSDLFEKRAELMGLWSSFLKQHKKTVIQLREAQ